MKREGKEVLLMEKRQTYDGLPLVYRIFAIRNHGYFVSVQLFEESRTVGFRTLYEAVRVFSILRKGNVTPCTVSDIVEELSAER